MIKPLLFVMNPRRIARAIDAINALVIDKVWFSNMYERDLVAPMAAAVERASDAGYTHILLLADDTVPSQDSLDLVLRYLGKGDPIVTAYCNLDKVCPHVNITRTPFKVRHESVADDYDWYTREEVDAWPEQLVPSQFAGACLTGYSVDLWRRFPFMPNVSAKEDRGYASDWNFCIRVQDAGIPIFAPRGAFVEHLKDDWRVQPGEADIARQPEKMLLVGVLPAEVRWNPHPLARVLR